MNKVTYKERTYIDRYTCIDTIKTRYFVNSWVVGGLTYFRQNQYNIFSIDTDLIINIEQ